MTDQQEDAGYDAYLLRYPDGSWLAQLADLPGAYATGATQADAAARLGAAIPAYFVWLRQHDEYTPITHDASHVIPREVAESSSGPIRGAFFSGDAMPVTEEDLDWWLAALDWAYGDLVARAQPALRSPQHTLLDAVAKMQLDVVARATGAQITAPAPATPDSLAMLQSARQMALAAFRRTNAQQRAAVREDAGERWSVRRGLRESALLVRRATDDLARIQA